MYTEKRLIAPHTSVLNEMANELISLGGTLACIMI